jgi:hypothetical protein
MNAKKTAQEDIDIMRKGAMLDEGTQQTTTLALKYYRQTEEALQNVLKSTSGSQFVHSLNKKSL